MPFVDRIIQFVQGHGGERIVLETDQNCVMYRADGAQVPVQQRFNQSQITGLLNEILPNECRAKFAAGQPFSFPYEDAAAAVDIDVAQQNGALRVTIGRRAAGAAPAAAPAPAVSAPTAPGPAPEAPGFQAPPRPKAEHIHELLRLLVEREASDLHIRVGDPPIMRIHGKLIRTEFPCLEPEDARNLLYSILNDERRRRYEENHELDLSYAIRGLARFRVNVFRQRGCVGAVL